MNRVRTQVRYFGTGTGHYPVHACGSCRVVGQFSCQIDEANMRVIAEAYGGEPLDRVVAGEDGDTVFLVNPNVNRTADDLANAGIGFPRSFVFRFSDSLWARLAGAWDRRDKAELMQLWAGAEHI